MSDTPVAAYATAKAFWGAHHEACRAPAVERLEHPPGPRNTPADSTRFDALVAIEIITLVM
jgi:hypothetical protein